MLPSWVNGRDHGEVYVRVGRDHTPPKTGGFTKLKDIPLGSDILVDDDDGTHGP